MQTFKQFISEATEDYRKLSPERTAELITHHEKLSKEHSEKSKEHKKVKPTERNSLEHSIAAEAHRDAAGLHHSVAYALKSPPRPQDYDNRHDLKVQAERMSKGANGRSELAYK